MYLLAHSARTNSLAQKKFSEMYKRQPFAILYSGPDIYFIDRVEHHSCQDEAQLTVF